MNRRNNRRKPDPNDIFGLTDLLDSWIDMMQMIPMAEMVPNRVRTSKPKHEGTMSVGDFVRYSHGGALELDYERCCK